MPFVYSYKPRSKGARKLAKSLGFKRLRHKESEFRGNFKPYVVNWGSSYLPPNVAKCKVINDPKMVEAASNKLVSFKILQNTDHIPMFWEDRDEAGDWVDEHESRMVVARKLLRSHSGKGIVIASSKAELPNAPLYVQYIKKTREFRVHIVMNEVVDVQEKRRKTDVPDDQVNWQVRNFDNGFIYARTDLIDPVDLRSRALEAFERFNLHFGAVDLIFNEKQNRCYVLEINTAPGLEGTTIDTYTKNILKKIVDKTPR